MEQVNLHSKITIPTWIFEVVKYLIPILLISTLTIKLFGFLFYTWFINCSESSLKNCFSKLSNTLSIHINDSCFL
jgi:hypothetical protein